MARLYTAFMPDEIDYAEGLEIVEVTVPNLCPVFTDRTFPTLKCFCGERVARPIPAAFEDCND